MATFQPKCTPNQEDKEANARKKLLWRHYRNLQPVLKCLRMPPLLLAGVGGGGGGAAGPGGP